MKPAESRGFGRLPILKCPGFGIELDDNKVNQTADLFDKNLANND